MIAALLMACLGGSAIAQAPGPEVGPDEFLRLMRGLHAEYRDVAFTYEGTHVKLDYGLTGDLNTLKYAITGERATPMSTFQGHFATRDDGAALYDEFIREVNSPGIITQTTHAILGDSKERLHRVLGEPADPLDVSKAAHDVLGQALSVGRLNRTWYFQTLDDPAALNYEFQGWEAVDGHRCLRVQLDDGPGQARPARGVYRFWIDLERGGHPLKTEHLRDGALWYRIDAVQLKQVPTADGKTVWLPVAGRSQQFVGSDLEQLDRPNFRESYVLAANTARINAALPDEVFSVYWGGGLPDTPELRRLRAVPSPPRPRNDPRSVQDRLDASLIKADALAERVEASSAARDSRGVLSPWSIALVALGILLIGSAVVSRWRKR